jgi:P pilus assembly chaperone PapD
MSTPREKSHPYRAYLLRCWREGEAASDREPLWRFSVEEILPERRRKGFNNLEALIAFLRAELEGSEDEPSDDESQ